jgi:hypothetical protein
MNSNIDNLLDGTLDDLVDLPEFKPFPNGVHSCTVSFESKKVNNHPCVEVTMKLDETIELANPEGEVAPAKGSESSVLYMLDNEIGQGKFKDLMKPFAEANPGMKLGQLIKECSGNSVIVVTSQRANKEKTKMYQDITAITLV